ncbi:hypothetical protein [Mycobacteroides abscessus]|uniref:hypothetical protein n=1 Tax=Mycobacteroides abscessus TaxID=36809 RepID=UPI000C257B5B|nr:hypothetical protein [Mycobacteroides abscessus]
MANLDLKDLVNTDFEDDDDDGVDAEAGRDEGPDENTTEAGGVARIGRPRGPVKNLATVYTPNAIFQKLKAHVSQRKAKGEIVSLGRIVLLAVRDNQRELSMLWSPGRTAAELSADEADDDLFGDITIRKAPPKKVPWQLHGAKPVHVAALDRLVDEWSAPSRSVLVEEALTLYFASLSKPATEGGTKKSSKPKVRDSGSSAEGDKASARAS